MSTPEQPLTRRQLKEMRRTGALPVVDPSSAPAAAEEPAHVGAPAPSTESDGSGLAGLPKAAPVPAPGPAQTPAEPEKADEPEDANEPGNATPPAAEAAPSRPLTRRQARVLRTNEIPVTESADDAGRAPEPAPAPAQATPASPVEGPADDEQEADASPAPQAAPPAAPEPTPAPTPAPRPAESPVRLPAGFTDALSASAEPAAAGRRDDETEPADGEERPKVGASFGAAVFQQAEERQRLERERAAREAQARREGTATGTVPAAEGELFAEAFQRSLDVGGSTASGTSLVLHDMPGTTSLSGPMTATGEFMITSSHVLPAGLASRGAASGTTDGKDIDATLMDGEIPLHSSPTPIAASSAVSTSKGPGDVIRPPQPEKNHGLMLTLGIVAGVLGVGLAGILIYAFATGVFG